MFFVRTASARDLNAIREVLIAAFKETYVPLHGPEKVAQLNAGWNSVEALKALIANPSGEFLVADNGKLIGGIAYACPDRSKPGRVALLKLYVHPAFQGKGIGSSLFAEIETCFPEARVLSLEVDIANRNAIAFYEAHGMRITGRTENCGSTESGIPAHVMEKDLLTVG